MNLDEAIHSLESRFTVEEAHSQRDRQACFALRHQVYCAERGFDIGTGSIETDEYDARSRHIALRRRGGEVIGTARLVLPPARAGQSLPMARVCAPEVLAGVPRATTAEISRFAISRVRRDMVDGTEGLVRLMLIKGVLRASAQAGLTHWCAVMEPTLLRLLRAASVHFCAHGPLVQCYGLRQPAVADIAAMLARGRTENPTIWNYVTGGGAVFAGEQAIAA